MAADVVDYDLAVRAGDHRVAVMVGDVQAGEAQPGAAQVDVVVAPLEMRIVSRPK